MMTTRFAERQLQVALDKVLEAIRDAYNIQCGLVYYWDAPSEALVCKAYGNHAKAEVISPFSYQRDAKSFAAKVYREPDSSPGLIEYDLSSPDVDQVHLAEYAIDGPMLGVPLRNARHQKVGVLVLWNRFDHGRPVLASDLVPIKSLAELAAGGIDALNYEIARTRSQTRLVDTLRRVQTEADRDKALSYVLRMNLVDLVPDDPVAFDRIRIYLYREGQRRFVAHLCEGMDKDAFRKQEISAQRDYCAAKIEACASHLEPKAQSFDLADGKDHDGIRRTWKTSHKGQPNSQWIAAPLVVGGQILGMIEADNGYGPRRIPAEALDLLEAMGTIAAGAIAAHDLTEKLSSDCLEALKFSCSYRAEIDVYSRVLTHLTIHHGLKFQRAFYFKYDEGLGRFLHRLARGSLDPAEHVAIATAISPLDYSYVLDKSSPTLDPDLNARMTKFTIERTEADVLGREPLHLTVGGHAGVHDLSGFMGRLHEAVRASYILTMPVKLRGHVLGVFVVDSPFEGDQWKKHHLFSDRDQRAFKYFITHHVAAIFEGNRSINNLGPSQQEREYNIAKILCVAHELRQITNKLGTLKGGLHRGASSPSLKDINVHLTRIDAFFESLTIAETDGEAIASTRAERLLQITGFRSAIAAALATLDRFAENDTSREFNMYATTINTIVTKAIDDMILTHHYMNMATGSTHLPSTDGPAEADEP